MDRAVQKTDHDAAASKRSAIERGYYQDKYLVLLCPTFEARLPLINIGTWCRVRAIDETITAFLSNNPQRAQIVSLGAGSDSRPFHLLPDHPGLVYHEVDFPVQTRKKAAKIRQHLASIVGMDEKSDIEYHTDRYHLHGQDLRTLNLMLEDIPTLVISECCLCYLKPEDSQRVIEHFAQQITDLSVVLYEPIGLCDEFGRVMAENLMQRGLCLPTFQKFSTLDAQSQRLRDLGLRWVQAVDMETYFNQLPPAERARVAHLEFLDEVEEMNLLLRHYCVVQGSTKPL